MRHFRLIFLPLVAALSLLTAVSAPASVHRVSLISSSETHHITMEAGIPHPDTDEMVYKDLPRHIHSPGYKAFVFDPKRLAWAAYDKYGFRVAHGVANGGADFCEEINEPCRTPVGHFTIKRRGGPDCASSQFPVGSGGAAMPYCMFFKNGCAIHGSPYVAEQNTSHGCIRVLTPAAKWLSRHFLKYGTHVIVLPY